MNTTFFIKTEHSRFHSDFVKFINKLSDDDFKLLSLNILRYHFKECIEKFISFCKLNQIIIEFLKNNINEMYLKLIKNSLNLDFLNRLMKFKKYNKMVYCDIILNYLDNMEMFNQNHQKNVLKIILYLNEIQINDLIMNKINLIHGINYRKFFDRDIYLNDLNIPENKVFNYQFTKIIEKRYYFEYYENKYTSIPFLKEGLNVYVYTDDGKISCEEKTIEKITYKTVNNYNTILGTQQYIKFEGDSLSYYNHANKYFRNIRYHVSYDNKKTYISLSKIDERALTDFKRTSFLFDYYKIIHDETLKTLEELFPKINLAVLKYIVKFI